MPRIPIDFSDPEAELQAAQDYSARLPVELPVTPQGYTHTYQPGWDANLVAQAESERNPLVFAPAIREGLTTAGQLISGEKPLASPSEMLQHVVGPNRLQTWPEQMVRSGGSLPADVYSGRIPVMQGEHTNPELIERTQDLAGMAGGGFAAKPNAVVATAKSSELAPLAALERAPVFYSALEHAVNNTTPGAERAAIDIEAFMQGAGAKELAQKVQEYRKENKDKKVGELNIGIEKLKKDFRSENEVRIRKELEQGNLPEVAKTGPEWIEYLKKQPLVKQEELDWVLHDLPQGKISKSELEKYVQEHKVELKEVNKGNANAYELEYKKIEARLNDIQSEFDKLSNEERLNKNADDFEIAKKRKDLYEEKNRLVPQLSRLDSKMAEGGTKYSQWQLPGGEPGSYREMIMTLPENTKVQDQIDLLRRKNDHIQTKLIVDRDNISPEYRSDLRAQAKEISERLVKLHQDQIINPNYTHSHWPGIVNPVAHIRMNERNIPGVGKSLHIEEGQSDLHQAGRHQGYVGEKEKLEPQFNKIEQKILDSGDEAVMSHPEIKDALKAAVDKKIITADEARTYQRYSDINAQQLAGNKPVMDAPFKKDATVDLVLKRMIRQAAEQQKDAISWTPGQAQADRYDLSKHIKEIQYKKYPDGSYRLGITNHKGEGVDTPQFAYTAKELPDIVGKEVAERIINEDGKKYRGRDGMTLENLDLKIGGEFHKKLYDEVWVNKANAIAKKFGGKVEQSEIPHPTDRARDAIANALSEPSQSKGRGQPIHVLRITPALRDAALNKGFSLFADTGKVGAPLAALTKVEHNPFKFGELEKQHNIKLTPVAENPFTTDAYHGGPHEFQGSQIRPKTKYDLRDVGDGNKRYYDIIYNKYIGPKFKDETKAVDWAAKKGLSEFYSTPNPNLANDYASIQAKDPVSHVMPLKLDTSDYFRVNAKGQTWDAVNDMAIYEANQQGKKGVTIYNVRDDANPRTNERGPQTVYITLDPSTVRSKFAKFDPAKFGESGLLKASGIPIFPVYSDEKGNQLFLPPPNPGRIPALEPNPHMATVGAAKAAEWLAFLGSRNYPRINGPLTAAWIAQWPMMQRMLKEDIQKQLKAGKKPNEIEFEPGSLGDMFGLISTLRDKFGAAHKLQPVSHDPFK